MKKILIALLTIISLASCDSLTSKSKIHWFSQGNKCYEVEDYAKLDNNTVYLIKFKDYGKVYISVNDIMIVTDKCPICEKIK